MHPLPDGAWPIDLQPLSYLVVACGQLVPGGSVPARLAQLRTHPSDEDRPALGGRPCTRFVSRLACRGDVLTHRVPIQPQALGDRPQRPSGRPVLQYSTTSATRKLLRPTATPLFESCGQMVPGAAASRGGGELAE